MSNIKISELGQAGALTGLELVPVVQDNLTLRTTTQLLGNFVSSTFANSILAGVGLQVSHPTPTTTEISIGYIAQDVNNISNNISADATSTTKYPSVNAIKSYADGLVIGLLNDRGNYTPNPTSPGVYPSSGGSGTGGAIQKGDIWFIDTVGYLGTTSVQIGASVRALVDSPSPTSDADWDILDAGLGYIPENVANKSDDGTLGGLTPSSTLYPTQAAVQAYVGSNTSRTLQNVLDAGNTALNQSITLNSATASVLLDTVIPSLYINDNDGQSIYTSVYGYMNNSNNGNFINYNTSNPKPLITIYRDSTSLSLEISDNTVQFNNSGFGGGLVSDTLTSNQVWTLPNASGTIALANNVWNATGNAGTVAGSNFIGTTDAIDFVAKTNNTERLRVLSTGQVKLSSLTGTGTRMVVASSTGQLSTQAIASPTLQTVTDAGNTTTNSVIVKNTTSFLGLQNTAGDTRAMFDISSDNGRVVLYDTDGNNAILECANLTGDRTYQLPDNDGTIALLSDINTGNYWSLAGNTGTTPGTDFIGTTDNKDLIFKANNIQRLRIDSTYGDIYTDTSFRAIGVDTSIQAFNGSVGIMIANDYILKPYIYINNGTGTAQIQSTNLTSPRIIELPDASGTIALTTTVTLQNVLAGTNKNLTNGINLQGTNAGGGTFSGSNINGLGGNAAYGNLGSNVNALGYEAAMNNTIAGTYVNAFGYQAAKGNSGGYVNAIGSGAAQNNTGSDVNAFGNGAGSGNTINGATIFSNASLPSYANYAAAAAAITTGAGGTAGCTYLYHDQATNSIGAVRL